MATGALSASSEKPGGFWVGGGEGLSGMRGEGKTRIIRRPRQKAKGLCALSVAGGGAVPQKNVSNGAGGQSAFASASSWRAQASASATVEKKAQGQSAEAYAAA